DTAGSAYDTALAVYTGSGLSNLVLVVANDNEAAKTTSRVTFPATSGTAYVIATAGKSGATGYTQLNLAATVANDNFASAIPIAGTNATVTGTNAGASKEPGEPDHAGKTGGRSVWWTWTAPASGSITIKTEGSDFDTLLAVYTGGAVNNLTSVASDDDSGAGTTSLVTFNAVVGTAYFIAVDGFNGGSGAITLSIAQGTVGPVLQNDNFASATVINGFSVMAAGSNANATKQTGEPNHAGNPGGRSVWWTWQPAIGGPVTIRTTGSSFDTVLAVYTGTNVAALTLVASNDQDAFGGNTSGVTFSATAGTIYRIAVDGAGGASGSIALVVSMPVPVATGMEFFVVDGLVQTSLYRLDPASTVSTLVGTGSLSFGLDFRSNGTLYACTSSLRTISLTTGATTTLGSIGQTSYSLAFSPGDELYVLSSVSGGRQLSKVNPGNGQTLSSVAITGTTHQSGAVFAGELFGIDFAPDGTLYGIGYSLYRIDPATGVATKVNAAGTQVAGVLFSELDYGNDGYLRAFSSGTTGELYLINPANGVGQRIGTTNRDFTGLASRGATAPAPTFAAQPANQSASAGDSANFSVTASGATSYQWQRNGAALAGATATSLAVASVQSENTGLYTVLANGATGVTTGSTSQAAILGLLSTAKVIGAGTEVGANILHANGNTFDQVLLGGAAATVTADSGQILRISYVDLTNDIVQIEMSGAGALSVVLDSPTGPALAVNYNQPTVNYMKGHAGIVIAGADETTNLSVFSVGRANAVNQALFRSDVAYDGHADLAFVAILSRNGQFGGLRSANASYFATRGLTGIYAPGVTFNGPVFVGEVAAFDTARGVLVLGSATDVRITGGDLLQPNDRAVAVEGIAQLRFVAGSDSHGNVHAASRNRARFEQNGTDVTTQIVVNPGP
ncbi:MAG: pre-peptidase C-terminal domain-containing protein, partial [Opitutaceae bacterium]